ncbi:MAG: recombinase family protein [Clostridiales bacterium]|jgi:DNA invertase Pin-like site-specific DNA recombinase|nr:recombinase family protein [Clostridiales bacterium]
MSGEYCVYLRKSRADAEAEARGEGETLARHEKELLGLAKRQNLNITRIYKEIVSGETIAARPVMQRLLSEVESGEWDGVLVTEVERLARGDTIDQGIMAQTFKYSGAKIITPSKTYDPNNEFDEEYFEFGLFMSRREYKTINRRLQRGRAASAKEGKFVGNKAPYGYNRVKLETEKGWTLEENPAEAAIVRLIFAFYTEGERQADGSYKRLGVSLITRRLNEIGSKPRKSEVWIAASVRDILTNPVYIGKIRWNFRPTRKKTMNGKKTVSRPRKSDYLLSTGLHKPIVKEETWNSAQFYMKKNPPKPCAKEIKNPLAGLVFCGFCGRRMVRRPYVKKGLPDTLMCAVPQCPNISAKLGSVENCLVSGISDWISGYKLEYSENMKPARDEEFILKENLLKSLDSEAKTLKKQRSALHDLLEQGVYDTITFAERSKIISEKISGKQAEIDKLAADIKEIWDGRENAEEIIPRAEYILSVYSGETSPAVKNALLLEIIDKVVYTKTEKAKKGSADDNFRLDIYPKIPRASITDNL